MATVNLRDTIKYIEQNSFEDLAYESPTNLVITGKQFAIARLSDYGLCPSYDALAKFIESKGGEIKTTVTKSVNYLIITPSPTSENSFAYKKEQEKYEKAVDYHRTQGRPRIIRDVDFYITTDMFSKLAANDKRRLVLEYVNGNPTFTEKTAKKVIDFIAKKANDDEYLRANPAVMAIAKQAAEENIKNNQATGETANTLKQWRKYFSLSEGIYHGQTGLIIKKCKMLQETVEIPSEIEGIPVICVERKAFANLDNTVKTVIIPKSVIGIENSAFNQCNGLQRIEIQNPECYIACYSFTNCSDLNEIIVNGANVTGGESRLPGLTYVSIK